jgi:hypothetical protein
MNKLIISITIVVVLSSCAAQNGPDKIRAQGTIEKTEMTYYQYGTHILVSEAGETLYALRSSTYELDEYQHQKIELTGTPVKGYPVEGGPDYLEVTGIKLLN